MSLVKTHDPCTMLIYIPLRSPCPFHSSPAVQSEKRETEADVKSQNEHNDVREQGRSL